MRDMLLVIIAIILFGVLAPLGILFAIIYSTNIRGYMYQIAKAIDQFGNVVCQYLFNVSLIKKNGYKFGNEDEVISSVIGKNFKTKTLTAAGRILNRILNRIDPDHTVKSIEL